eukprot:3336677-Amphidinium_carterae.1
MGNALRGHLSLPCDLSGDDLCAVLAIPESKTSSRTVKMQSIMISDAKLIRLMTYIYGNDPMRAPLCPGGLRGLQRRYTYLKLRLGLASSPWTLGSIRGGGAVEFLKRTQNVNYLQWKGRWANPKNMSHYLQASLGVVAFTSLPMRDRELVLQLARCAPVMFDVDVIAKDDGGGWNSQTTYDIRFGSCHTGLPSMGQLGCL